MPEHTYTLLPGEKDAVRLVIALGAVYGYGNLIAHLGRAWAIHLTKGNPNITYDEAVKLADGHVYPEHLDGFEDVP